ncbi:NET1-associated nuclear protein 1 [Trichomonascus vanleenenianus]|uniref:Nan1p n=1 Tax=Trichomonascus vanleenenianus TaxID=2268995 RepID=UPI003ECB101E
MIPKRGKQPSWKVTSTVGGKFTKVKPAFTKDKAHFIVLTSLELRVYLLATKQCVRSVPIDSNNVTDLFLDSQERVWVSRSTGKCDIVNWQEKTVESVDLGHNVLQIIKIMEEDKAVVAVTAAPGNQTTLGITRIPLEDPSKHKLLTKVKNAKLFALSTTGSHYAFYSAHKKVDYITVGRFVDEFGVKEKTFKRSRPLLALAVSDTGVVAAGSVTGVIDLYYKCFEEPEPTARALKWHVDSVLALSFSLDGEYLLSGGKEKVLVFWQLETDNTQFLPRLDGEINGITVDPTSELYALTLGDDQVLVLSAVDLVSRLQVSGVKAVFARLPNDPEKEKRRRKNRTDNDRVGDFTAPLYLNPKTKHAYFPTKSGSHIQVYNPLKDDQVQVFSIASTIQTGKVKSENLLMDPQVTHVAFSKDGEWMATVDETTTPPNDRLMSKDDREISLKFWSINKAGKWELATRVQAPHGANKSVLDIVPCQDLGFVTAAVDGGVRLWRPTFTSSGVSHVQTRTVAWSVRKILPPPSAMSLSAVSLAWSPDSSMLVMGFETSIYVIDAARFTVCQTLPNMLGSRVRSLHIVGTHLMALSKSRLVVWDLINERQRWSVQIFSPTGAKRLIAVDQANQRLAVAVNHFNKDFQVVSKVFVFSIDSPVPLHIENHRFAISALSLVPGSANYMFMDVQGRISTLALLSSVSKAATVDEAAEEKFVAEMSQLFNIRQNAAKSEVDETTGRGTVINVNSFDRVFEGPEYSLDSLQTMFDKVLGVISPKV